MKRVLLTGGTGFIGRHSLPLLLGRGYDVHASYSAQPGAPDAGVSWHRADLLDPEQTAALVEAVQPTHLLHFAWYAVPGKFWASPENVRWVEASLRLVRLFAAAGGRRVVGAGTCAEYDWSDGFCSERTTPLAPATLYGTCKHAVQTVAARLAAQVGFSVAWGRIFFVYGPAEHPARLVSSVIRALLAGETAPCSEGTQLRDFLYSEDVASAFVHLLDSDVEGPVNIASGAVIAIRDLVSLIGEFAARPELIRFGELPQRPDDPSVLQADVRRLQDEVGWTPSVTLEAGVKRTVEWWRANLSAQDARRRAPSAPGI